jgi:alkyl sulfatase BDS1-like metallo-beta-lactamase superfamily hydrolase
MELRDGVPKVPGISTANADTLKAISNELFFDFMGVRLNATKAEGKTMVINWNFTDSKQQYVLTLENSALTYVPGRQAANADATITLARGTLDAITLRKTTFPDALQAGLVKVDGDPRKLGDLLSMLDTFSVMFEIVEPRATAQ